MAATKSTTTKKSPPAKRKVAAPKVTVKREVPSKDVLDLPVYPEDQATIDRLVAMVPPKERLDIYVHREFADTLSDFEFFEYAHQTGQNILLPGPTGSGKSHALEAYAAWKRLPFGWLDGSRLTRIDDVYGEYAPSEEDGSKLTFIEGNFTLVFKWGGVWVFEELNMVLEGVSARLFTVFDDHRAIQLNNQTRDIIRGDERTLIAGCYNPGYAGGRELNRALKRRFLVRRWDYDRATEEKLVQSGDLLDFAKRVRDAVGNGTLQTPLPTSALIEFEQRLYQIGEAKGFNAGWNFAKGALLDQYEDDELGAVKNTFELSEDTLTRFYFELWFDASAEEDDSEEEAEPAEPAAKKRSVKGGTAGNVLHLTRITARHNGTCKSCGDPIQKGSSILYGGRGHTYHDDSSCTPSGASIKSAT